MRSCDRGDSGRLRRRARNDFWRSTIALDKRSAKSFIRINEKIRAREIRVIDENGEQLGILAPFEAMRIARERGLDLVEVSANAVPPVCRIQDYGRFLYEKEKSDRAAKKKQKVITVKECKFSVTVDEHDYQTKKNQAVRFLNDGDKVKASLRFRGRQMAHRELGYAIINQLDPGHRRRRHRRVHAAHGRHDSARHHCAVKEAGSAQAQAARASAAASRRAAGTLGF